MAHAPETTDDRGIELDDDDLLADVPLASARAAKIVGGTAPNRFPTTPRTGLL